MSTQHKCTPLIDTNVSIWEHRFIHKQWLRGWNNILKWKSGHAATCFCWQERNTIWESHAMFWLICCLLFFLALTRIEGKTKPMKSSDLNGPKLIVLGTIQSVYGWSYAMQTETLWCKNSPFVPVSLTALQFSQVFVLPNRTAHHVQKLQLAL